jgi:hypothetical protein
MNQPINQKVWVTPRSRRTDTSREQQGSAEGAPLMVLPLPTEGSKRKKEDWHEVWSAEHRMDTPNTLCDADCSRCNSRQSHCSLRHIRLLVITTSCCKQPQKLYNLSHWQQSGWPWLIKLTYFKSNHYSDKTAG